MDATGPTGQRSSLDVPALNEVETALVEREQLRGRLHAAQLRDVLEHRRLHLAAGSAVAAGPSLAVLLGCSEWHARMLTEQAGLLTSLPGALTCLESGHLTVEGARAVVDLLLPLDLGPRVRVWELLRTRLQRDAELDAGLTPPRLRDVLRRLILRVDAEGARARRRHAVRDSGVELRKRDDGLVDLLILGIGAVDGQAVLTRLDALDATGAAGDTAGRSSPVDTCPGGQPPAAEGDGRTLAARRRDAAVGLLLGRLPAGTSPETAPTGCQVLILVPLTAALAAVGAAPSTGGNVGASISAAPHRPGQGDRGSRSTPRSPDDRSDRPEHRRPEPQHDDVGLAELAGHGPLQPDEIAAVLVAAPVLRPVWTDARGRPAEVGSRTIRPGPDPGAVRAALLALAHSRPPESTSPSSCCPTAPHGPGAAGGYRPGAALARLVAVRSPACEWPGCGARASRCDLDHDLAWPAGPTCACNLGPLCRRHHRAKQTGWTKTRRRCSEGVEVVRWTSPTGRTRGTVLEPVAASGATPAAAPPAR